MLTAELNRLLDEGKLIKEQVIEFYYYIERAREALIGGNVNAPELDSIRFQMLLLFQRRHLLNEYHEYDKWRRANEPKPK